MIQAESAISAPTHQYFGVEEVKKEFRKEIQEESARSDYIDENFEIDENKSHD